MYSAALWIFGFFVVFLLICLAVYIAVVRAFYWGDKKEPPRRKKD